jgi:hypothetical protein
MDKLIELLNEYEKSWLNEFEKYNNAGIVEWVEHTKWNLYWRYRWNTWSYMVVISKEYGFIKRLVDNDKIEFREDFYLEDQHWWWFWEDENIIMLLSIQDNPIEFLVKILK